MADPFVIGEKGPALGGKGVVYDLGANPMFAPLALPLAILTDILNAVIAAGTGQYDGTVVRLYKNDFSPNKGTVLADLIQADFTGYTPSTAVVWGTPVTGPAGWPESIGGSKLFTATGPAVTNVIYGYYLTNAAGTEYRGGARFPASVNIANAGNFVHVTPVLDVGNLLGV